MLNESDEQSMMITKPPIPAICDGLTGEFKLIRKRFCRLRSSGENIKKSNFADRYTSISHRIKAELVSW